VSVTIEPTLVISDTHLAHPKGKGVPRAAMLGPLWRDHGIAHLIVNGDVAEIHDPFVRGAAARQVLQLYDRCEADHVRLTLLSGNHDPFLTDHRFLQLAQDQVFITHGDVLHPAIVPWCRHADQYRAEMAAALAALPPDERHRLENKLAAAQHASHRHWLARQEHAQPQGSLILDHILRPLSALRILHYWLTIPAAIERFVAQHAPATRFFLFGHSHRHGVWRRGPLTILNTGSFAFPGKPRAIRLDTQGVHLLPIQRDPANDAYRLGPPLAQFPWPSAEGMDDG
jgi:predicted phosphodiesterase